MLCVITLRCYTSSKFECQEESGKINELWIQILAISPDFSWWEWGGEVIHSVRNHLHWVLVVSFVPFGANALWALLFFFFFVLFFSWSFRSRTPRKSPIQENNAQISQVLVKYSPHYTFNHSVNTSIRKNANNPTFLLIMFSLFSLFSLFPMPPDPKEISYK